MLKNHTGKTCAVMDAKQSGCHLQADKKYDEVWHFGNTNGEYFTERIAELK